MKLAILASLIFGSLAIQSQSFNEERKSLINYVSRMYTNAAFEGGKRIEADGYNICAVAIKNDSVHASSLPKAWSSARIAFGEPCVQFENIGYITSVNKQSAQLYLCVPLSEYIKSMYLLKPFNGAKIVRAPQKDLIISVITLENGSYNSESLRDRVAQMKARQNVNILMNGSTITSDLIIQTEKEFNGQSNTITSEMIREQSLGFVSGMSLLFSFTTDNSNTTYIYYSENN